jgi:hypothetical protein
MSERKVFKNKNFIGCSTCDAKCCGSTISFVTTFDIELVSKHFPIFFLIENSSIYLGYFLYGANNSKCFYLKDNLCSIYEKRPLACMTYPFSKHQKSYFYDTNCPNIIDGNMNTSIINRDFLSINVDYYKEETKKFVDFCVKGNFLVKFTDYYNTNEKYIEFRKEMNERLYIIHPQRLAVMRMRDKNIFLNNEKFFNYILTIISSIQNIDILSTK